MIKIKRGDIVYQVGWPGDPLGMVIRCARDGSWADVRWKELMPDGSYRHWSKRARQKMLRVKLRHTS